MGGVPGPGGCTCPGTPPPVNRMTNMCKNITLPQTSFAGGNNRSYCNFPDVEIINIKQNGRF